MKEKKKQGIYLEENILVGGGSAENVNFALGAVVEPSGDDLPRDAHQQRRVDHKHLQHARAMGRVNSVRVRARQHLPQAYSPCC